MTFLSHVKLQVKIGGFICLLKYLEEYCQMNNTHLIAFQEVPKDNSGHSYCIFYFYN